MESSVIENLGGEEISVLSHLFLILDERPTLFPAGDESISALDLLNKIVKSKAKVLSKIVFSNSEGSFTRDYGKLKELFTSNFIGSDEFVNRQKVLLASMVEVKAIDTSALASSSGIYKKDEDSKENLATEEEDLGGLFGDIEEEEKDDDEEEKEAEEDKDLGGLFGEIEEEDFEKEKVAEQEPEEDEEEEEDPEELDEEARSIADPCVSCPKRLHRHSKDACPFTRQKENKLATRAPEAYTIPSSRSGNTQIIKSFEEIRPGILHYTPAPFSEMHCKGEAVTTKEAKLFWLAVERKKPNYFTELNIAYTKLGPKAGRWLGKAVKQLSGLRRLSISCNPTMGDNGIIMLAEGLRGHKGLRSLDLGSTNMGDKGLSVLLQAISPLIEELAIDRNLWGVEGAKWLARYLSTCRRLKRLYIAVNPIKEEGMKWIAPTLLGHKQLADLNVGFCEIGDEGAMALAKYLPRMKSLTYLSLTHNKIGESGARALATALEDHPLPKLDWGHNGGFTQLVDLMTVTKSIATLTFDGQAYTKGDIDRLLRSNRSLTRLEFQSNQFSEKAMATMFRAMQDNKTLTMLRILGGAQNVTDKTGEYLAEMLERNDTLTGLSLLHTKMGNKSLELLAKGLMKNQTLEYLIEARR